MILEQQHHEIKWCGKDDGMKQIKELTVQQAAMRLGVTLKYVRDLLHEQKLLGAYKKDRVWKIPASAVELRLKARQRNQEQIP
jgi:excisionase family DNA binding protein